MFAKQCPGSPLLSGKEGKAHSVEQCTLSPKRSSPPPPTTNPPPAGLNNEHLVKTRDELALLYNDSSVNESHHVATAFRMMREVRRGEGAFACVQGGGGVWRGVC